jgi:hypothetical protein
VDITLLKWDADASGINGFLMVLGIKINPPTAWPYAMLDSDCRRHRQMFLQQKYFINLDRTTEIVKADNLLG